MIWVVVMIIVIGGEPLELVGTKTYDTQEACHAELKKISAGVGMTTEWMATCISEVRA
jgi:hypothetical protein